MTSSYTYDAIYELTQVIQGTNTTESYSYDPVGNRLSSLGMSPYGYNASNELNSTPNASYAYDYDGNVTGKTVSSNSTSYAWDYENRLTSVTLPNSGGTVSFKYDPFGRRIEKTSPTATSIFVYDGYDLAETVNSAGGLVSRYAQGQKFDEPLAESRSGTISYYEQDGLGSVTSLTATNATVAQSYGYDSLGNATNSNGSVTNFFRYTGREFDTETNLYYYRARYYDPATGRFISEDPIGFGGHSNLYAYVSNDPIGLYDPLGLFSVVKHISITRTLDIDFACGSTNAGACTADLHAKVTCNCQCDGTNGWKAKATLIVTGNMYVSSAPWPYKGRKPVDSSVTNADSAIAHEWNTHINPAIAGVTGDLNALEANTYKTENDCQKACKNVSKFVGRLFGAILNATQQAEGHQ